MFADNFYPELSGIADTILITGTELAKMGHEITFFVPFIDLISVPEISRIVEDLEVIGQVQDYVDSSPETFKPAVRAQ